MHHRSISHSFLILVVALLLPATARADFRAPAGLSLSSHIPGVGETLVVRVDVTNSARNTSGGTRHDGSPVLLYQGFRPGCNGVLTNPVLVDTGVIRNGRCTFSNVVPNGTPSGLEFYLGAVIQTSQGPYLSEIQGLQTTPLPSAANWEVEVDGYTNLKTGQKIFTGQKSALVGAFNASAAGDVILVRKGDYTDTAPMTFSNPPSGGQKRRFILAEDARAPGHGVILKRLPFGGSPTVQLVNLDNVTFVGLKIEAERWGILWGTPTKPTSGIQFLETEIDGGWDFLTNSGICSKWAVQGKNSSDMLFRGGLIHDICQEHAFYIQNQTGDLTIENVITDRIGRTFLQTTARTTEGPPGLGLITVRNVLIRDAALGGNCQGTPGYQGGSALTFTGRHMGPSLVDNVIVQFGFNTKLNQVAGFNVGTGAFVTWLGNGSGNVPNGPVRLQNSQFQLAPGTGDRSNVMVTGGTSAFHFKNMRVDRPERGSGRNALEIAQDPSTLDLDPTLSTKSIKGAVKYFGSIFSTYPQFISSGILPFAAMIPPLEVAPDAWAQEIEPPPGT